MITNTVKLRVLCFKANRTKAIVIISPNNPTGAVYPPEILNKIIILEFENKDRLYKGTSHHKSKVRDEIKEIISQYALMYSKEEGEK